MVTAKILAIIAVILSALITIKQQKNLSSETTRAGASDSADASFNFSHYDLNKILDSYGR